MKNLYNPRMIEAWRSQYNPLRALNMLRIVGLLEAGDRGEYSRLQWLYQYVERRFPALLAGKMRRKSALEKCDWNIKQIPEEDLPAGATKAMAEQQATELRNLYEGISNLKQAIGKLELANFRGYTHLEKWLERDSEPWRGITRLEFVPQWHWVRHGIYGEWEYVADFNSGKVRGDAIDPNRFIIRECEDPFNEVGLILFMRHANAQKDWGGFLEVFGIPSIFAILPELDEDNLDKYLEMAEKVVGDSRGAIPHGGDVKAFESNGRGTEIFEKFSKYQEEQLVLVMTGGKLTMLTESGSGTLAGGAHKDSFDDIAQAEGLLISEVFQKQIDQPYLDNRFPGQPRLAWFEIASNEENDVADIVEQIHKLSQAGYTVDPDQVEEKTGYKRAEEAQEQSADAKAMADKEAEGQTQDKTTEGAEDSEDKGKKVTNRDAAGLPGGQPLPQEKLKALVLGALAEELEREFNPIMSELLESELSADDLIRFRDKLPELLINLTGDSDNSKFLETYGKLLSTAFVGGAVESPTIDLEEKNAQ